MQLELYYVVHFNGVSSMTFQNGPFPSHASAQEYIGSIPVDHSLQVVKQVVDVELV